MIIVGITGAIGHGKTTLANFLAKRATSHQHWETWEIVGEVAAGLRNATPLHPASDDIDAINRWLAPLPEILAATVHADVDFATIKLTPERCRRHPENYAKLIEYLDLMRAEPALQAGDITIANKQNFRPILQWLGGYFVVTVDEGVWYDEIVRRIRHAEQAGKQLATVGGVRFPGDAERLRNAGGVIIEIRRPEFGEADRQDLTERERALIIPDSVVINDGSLADLETCSAAVYEDLKIHALKPRYDAAIAK